MRTQYAVLKEAFDAFTADEMTLDALKTVTAPFGIYPQRNGNFMVRVRVNGGEITCDKLAGLADFLDRSGGYAHLTSRQDLQLHDLPAERAVEAVVASDRLGLPFKGGGGNTYRNILVGSDSGLSADSVFDVYPYAHALNRAMQKCEKAFALPRKLKIGFFASERDRLQAAVQDLGFVAQMRDGQAGFTVFVAGGMGRESSVGLELFGFLPATQIVRVAVALTDLFYDHGDRVNRQHARLRFLLKSLGAVAFQRLYLEYFARTEEPVVHVREEDHFAAVIQGLKRSRAAKPDAGFALWEQMAVLPTRFGDAVKSVRLYVPFGNLHAGQLRKIAALAAEFGSPTVRLLTTQDMLIPLVHRAALASLHKRLRQELAEIDLTFASYKGHLVTCVGATVCKIGMVDAPAVADRLAAALDSYLPPDTPEKLALLRLVADNVRISGCPNSCAGHPAARIGVGCINLKVDGVIQPFARVVTGTGVTKGVPCLSADGENDPPQPLETAVVDILAKCLDEAGLA